MLLVPSAFVPPPSSSRLSGIPQDWQFLKTRLLAMPSTSRTLRLGALADLLGRQLLLVRCESLDVSERILQRAGPVAVGLIVHRPERHRAGVVSPVDPRVHVFDGEKNAHRGSVPPARPA